MKLQLENLGAIQKADIALEGITIIAGENNVGKSTVGKALYAFFHDMSSWKQVYDDICSSNIERFLYRRSTFLEDWCMKLSKAKRRRTSKADQLQKHYAHEENFLVAIEDYQVAEEKTAKAEARDRLEKMLGDYCYDYVFLYAEDQIQGLWRQSTREIEDWIEKAVVGAESLELDELQLQTQRLVQSFQEVFNFQYRRIGTRETRIRFTDDDGRTVTFFVDDKGGELDQPIRLSNRVFFIESPKIYDYLSNTRYGHVQKEYLRYLMSPNIFKKGNPIAKLTAQDYDPVQTGGQDILQDIERRLVSVMGGRAEFLQKVGLEFKDEQIAEPIHPVNVSTGLKSMALLEYALRIGAIEEGDILILDEPEINLHPQWQLEYARTLVHLQKAFHLKIVITSHSPYFMRAIECFTDVCDTMDCLNVYRVMKKQDNEVQITNVSYSEFGMTDLYDDLSAPLEALETMLDEKYGE